MLLMGIHRFSQLSRVRARSVILSSDEFICVHIVDICSVPPLKNRKYAEELYVRVKEHWNRLPSKVVESPMEILMIHLDSNLCDLL